MVRISPPQARYKPSLAMIIGPFEPQPNHGTHYRPTREPLSRRSAVIKGQR